MPRHDLTIETAAAEAIAAIPATRDYGKLRDALMRLLRAGRRPDLYQGAMTHICRSLRLDQ